MSNVFVFGHKNPDTDSICSAISYAYLKNEIGMQAEPIRLGELNNETLYALEKFAFEQPRLVERVSEEVSQVILVDHNERQQSAEDIGDVQVIEVIDHHRIANFETTDPLYFRAEPVGCTTTILLKLFKENGVEIPANIAGLMLSAIISDSLLFKSPTCTPQDIAAARELAEIAKVDAEEYGLAMLKAGADLSNKTLEDLMSLDSKEFEAGDHRFEVAQVNAIDVNDVITRQKELEVLMQQIIAEKGLDLFAFVVTDILNNNSVAIVLGRRADIIEGAFKSSVVDNRVLLPGVVSRKKQIVPVITEALS
ncbi:inorganic pyrophosphatase [Planococcus glaciei]|uniref:Probable manganese-dependent inorganic pyrophosphatase n=1 Tax=Planococcus glaciei TaxID=459472 RepID=A0A1G7Z777_9BACL|nr:manganese-dependent inorganic pyrophosphatase [Planococcus glaciei]ETP68481.1 pyrophosphatase [Planococcus glaciei CHR43]KOF10825.1 inorganic pyrophosphatase [Planococcus glaciei]MBX0316517.1 manganese-dependent inorganic pyrophosphatase [Planococcus glaciei]QDY45631.1 manganese-dependent inorganic pyrophosphatase [Planococcus glaciei]QKX50809.1 manganese-dependent inorganic pyrophosphatase [Planococcus glaciei]